MLVQRRRRWTSIGPALAGFLHLIGNSDLRTSIDPALASFLHLIGHSDLQYFDRGGCKTANIGIQPKSRIDWYPLFFQQRSWGRQSSERWSSSPLRHPQSFDCHPIVYESGPVFRPSFKASGPVWKRLPRGRVWKDNITQARVWCLNTCRNPLSRGVPAAHPMPGQCWHSVCDAVPALSRNRWRCSCRWYSTRIKGVYYYVWWVGYNPRTRGVENKS